MRRLAPALLCLLLLGLGGSPVRGENRRGEPALENRLDAMLAGMLGRGKARVFIRTELSRVPAPAGKTAARAKTALWDDIALRIENAPPVLPGYRIPRSLRTEALEALKTAAAPPPRPSVEATHRTAVVVVDSGVTSEQKVSIREMISAALGIPHEEIRLQTASIAPLLPALSEPISRSAVYTWATLLLLLLASVYLLPALAAALRTAALEGPRLPHFPWPLPDERLTPSTLASLRTRHVPTIVSGLLHESPETAVEVLRSLDIEIAADVFRRLPGLKRRSAAEALLRPSPRREPGKAKTPPPPFKERLLKQVDKLEDGEGLLEELLLRCREQMRADVLSNVSREFPAEVERLREHLVTLNDLTAAEPAALRTCLSSFSSDELALSLYEVPEEIRSRILSSLPDLIGEVVRAQSKHLVPDDYLQVTLIRSEIYTRWKRLEECGRVRYLRRPPAAAVETDEVSP